MTKEYNLAQRTLKFAQDTRAFIRILPRTISNIEDISQLVRSSGSIGANYIEASESLSKKDFCFRIKISRKEAKESIYWLHLLSTNNIIAIEKQKNSLILEATELMKIFGSIVTKSSSNLSL